MSNKTFIRTALISIAVAATAASLFTVSGAMDASKTPAGKLAVACGVAYDKKVFLELNYVFSKQATALNRLGLGGTKDDVCAEVTKVANGKADEKVSVIDYGNAAYHARAVLGAAILYRSSLSGATLDKATLQDMGRAFDVTGKALAAWVPGKATPAKVKEQGVSFMSDNLAQGGSTAINLTVLTHEPFIDYVKSISP